MEEQFYVFAPWAVRLLSRKGLWWLCSCLVAGSLVWLFVVGSSGSKGYIAWCNPFVQFQSFAGGMALCLALRGTTPRLHSAGRAGLVLLGGLCWFTARYWLGDPLGLDANPGPGRLMAGYALSSCGAVMILAGFLGIASREVPDWAVRLGRISYGLYVFHVFAQVLMVHCAAFLDTLAGGRVPAVRTELVQFPSSLALTMVMAALSYRYLEGPFLRWKQRYALVASGPPSAMLTLR